MTLLDFTSYADIRAALGVSSDEIEDTTLSLSLYEYNLVAELEEINLELITDYLALSTTPSDLELRFKQATSLFATYAVAKQLTVSLPLFSPKEIGDGKAHMTRYAQDPYKATIDAVLSEYEKTRNRLVAAYNAVKLTTTEAPTLRTYFSSVLSGSDPVTGT